MRYRRDWFYLDLQAVSSPSLSFEAKCDNLATHIVATPCKVLIIDDNEDNRFLLLQYLRDLGFVTKEARDGAEGIAIAQELQPDVILVDLLMPVMDGKETIKLIRQDTQLQDTVILMISANVQLIEDSSEIQYDEFLAKPIDLDKLLELLEKHVGLEWQTLNKESQPIAIAEVDFAIPPQEKLIELSKLASLGLIKRIEQQMSLLEEIDSQYIYFVNKVRHFTENYQQDNLQTWLENLIL